MAKAKNELQKYKSSAGMVPNLQKQLADKKKKLEILGSDDSGSGDKPNSEYEMLLSEKDAIIAEYLSGLESNFLILFKKTSAIDHTLWSINYAP